MREVIAAIALVCLFLIPGSAFAYWVPDYYGQGIGTGLPGTQGGYHGSWGFTGPYCGYPAEPCVPPVVTMPEQGPGLPGTQGGYPGDNLGGLPGLPWLRNILSGIFGNAGNSYAPVYGGYPGYYHPGPCSCSWYHHWWYHPNPTWQQGQTSDIQIYGSGNTVGVTQGQGQDGGY